MATLQIIAFAFCLLLPAYSLPAQSPGDGSPVKARIVADVGAIVPGKEFRVGVLLKMAPGWHTYFREPGDSGLATSIRWDLPKGFIIAGDLQWPKPIQDTEPGGLKVNVYKEEVLLMASIAPPADIADPQVVLRAKVKWLACKESCIPGEAEVSLALPVAQTDQARPAAAPDAQLFEKYRGPSRTRGDRGTGDRGQGTASLNRPPSPVHRLPGPSLTGGPTQEGGFLRYLFFAFIGGLILNAMPCVLPVISLKILGFLQHGNESPGRIRTLGLVYAFGVFCSFLLMAGFVIATQQAGNLAGWGLQFQSPVFVVVITTLVTLVSLNLFGLFEVTLGSPTLTAASGLASKDGMAGAFLNGVFAVILATPCTAPFLGAALGFAFLQPPLIVVLFFLTVALGLALPYVLLCSFPGLIRFLPKPGAWMERFKVAMGFPMLATAVWLYSVAYRHYGGGNLWLGLFLVVLALAAWIYGEFVQRGRTHRSFSLGIVFLLIIGGYAFALENRLHWRVPAGPSGNRAALGADGEDGIQWRQWTAEALESARNQGHPVLVDFTADWCLTCQTNKVTSLEIPAVREYLKREGFVALLGDYTQKNDAISRELKKFGRAGVPLVVVYPVQGDPLVLPELLTPATVMDALRLASADR